MKFLAVFLCLLTLSTAAFAACEGFNNGLAALEDAIKQTEKPVKTASAKPPIASINRSIDALEKAIEQNRHKKRIQTPKSVQTRH